MASVTPILIHVADGIATLTLNKPEKRNAMNAVLIAEMMTGLKKLLNDSNVYVVLIKANGKHFCAGADIAWMQTIAHSTLAENTADARQLAELMHLIHTFPKPVIALVHGASLGGGLGLISACDIAIAGRTSTFSFSEVKVGITPSVISPYIIAAIGERAARYYFLTAENFGAEEAHRLGLIHQIVADDALDFAGISVATTILKHSPHAIKEAKQIIQSVAGKEISPSLIELTYKHLATMRMTKDAQEGLRAFLEKRAPRWS